MKKAILKIFVLILLQVVGWQGLQAQITAQEAIKDMGRGINLGNTFDAPNYEGEWGRAAQEYYFDMYADAGFKTIRIPITWNKRLGTVAPYSVNEDFFKRIDTVIGWALDRDLYAIINVHHDGWIKDKNTFDAQKPRFYALWEQLSERYKGFSEKLIFEIVNEPHSDNSITVAQVDELNSEALDIIRVKNPTRLVLYGGANWSSSADLLNAAIPNPDDVYLMAYYHSYDPWNFAGEGEGTWGSINDIQDMENQMIKVKNWSNANNIPVLIGEFGAQKGCVYNSRMLYYANYASLAVKHGLAWAEWDDDGDFQTLVRKDSVWNDIKDVLIYSSDSSITNVVLKTVEDTVIELSWEPRGNAELIQKILIEKRMLDTEFTVVAELSTASGTTFVDRDAVVGEYTYYRVLDVYAVDTIPSYPQNHMLIATDREPYDGVITIPGTIEAENFDKGGEMLTFHDTDPKNQGGAYRLDEAVDIEAREDGFQVGYVEAGEWLEYTVNVEKTADYKITALLASMAGGGEMRLRFGNAYAPIIVAPKTGSWTELQEVSVVAKLQAGEQILRLSIESIPAFNIDKFLIEEYDGTGIVDQESLFTIYPNPVNDKLFIHLENEVINEVCIYNSNGQLIEKQTAITGNVEVLTGNYKSGMYYVMAKTNLGLHKATFIKH